MTRPAFIRQPGPPAAARFVAIPCRGRALRLRLKAGERLLDAVAQGFARFEAVQDAETNFKLFEPVAAPGNGRGAGRALALRLRPNIPFLPTLDDIARDAGFAPWRARGGVGSLIGARFLDGVVHEAFATEVFLRAGAGPPREIGLVDMTGALRSGAIRRDDNPVLMTFELCLVEAG